MVLLLDIIPTISTKDNSATLMNNCLNNFVILVKCMFAKEYLCNYDYDHTHLKNTPTDSINTSIELNYKDRIFDAIKFTNEFT